MRIDARIVIESESGYENITVYGEDMHSFQKWYEKALGKAREEGRQEVLDNIYKSIKLLAQ